MGQKSCFPTIKPSLLFLDVHVHLVIMTGRERMPTDSHGSLHCCIFKNVSGLNCLKFCSRGKNTTGGIISKWNDFHPRHYLSLQISAPGPSFQQAGRSLGILMLNVRNALDTVVGAPVQAVVLSEVRVCSGSRAEHHSLGTGFSSYSREIPSTRMESTPAQPAPPSLSCSLCNGCNKTRNKPFFPYFLQLSSALVTLLGLTTSLPLG